MTSKEKNGGNLSKMEIAWNPEDEVQLFYALNGLKPIGINRHFYMVCVAEKLSKAINVEFSTEQIWNHLYSMYNLEAIETLETLPFPNEVKEFALPDVDFAALIAKKRPLSHSDDNRTATGKFLSQGASTKDTDKKILSARANINELPKRIPKRTRGSTSIESNSPSTTPPPIFVNKRRRI